MSLPVLVQYNKGTEEMQRFCCMQQSSDPGPQASTKPVLVEVFIYIRKN